MCVYTIYACERTLQRKWIPPTRVLSVCATATAEQDYVRVEGVITARPLSIYMHAHTHPRPATDDNTTRRPPLHIHPTEGLATRSNQWRAMTRVYVHKGYDNIIYYYISLSVRRPQELCIRYFFCGLVYANNYISISVENYPCCSYLNCIYFNLPILNDSQRIENS